MCIEQEILRYPSEDSGDWHWYPQWTNLGTCLQTPDETLERRMPFLARRLQIAFGNFNRFRPFLALVIISSHCEQAQNRAQTFGHSCDVRLRRREGTSPEGGAG